MRRFFHSPISRAASRFHAPEQSAAKSCTSICRLLEAAMRGSEPFAKGRAGAADAHPLFPQFS